MKGFRRRSNRGGILLLSLFVMTMLQLLAVAFLRLLPVEATAARRAEHGNVASLIAEAGVTEALAWLKVQLAPPDGSPAREPMHPSVYPGQNARTRQVGGEWSYRWELIADSETYPNGGNSIRGYTIVSKAYFSGIARREVRAQVLQDTFSRYARFYNVWPSSMVYPVRTNTAPAGGPIHVNDKLRLWISEGAAFWSSTGPPAFSHGLTASGVYDAGHPGQDGFAYYQGNQSGSDLQKLPYHPNLGPIKERYNRMVSGGQQNLKSGVAKLNLPSHTFNLREAAWGFGNINPLPSVDGVFVNTDGSGQVSGGVYLRGVVEELELGYGGVQPAGPGSVDYQGNSWIKVEQPGEGRNSIDAHQCVTVISVEGSPVTLPAGSNLNGNLLSAPYLCPTGSTLIRRADGNFQLSPGKLNGVVYANQEIQNLWGTNKGPRTVAVESVKETARYGKIVIGGHEQDSDGATSVSAGRKGLLQFEVQDADADGVLDPPSSGEHVLGLVAYDVEISSKLKPAGSWATAHPAENPLYVYANVLAGIPEVGGGYKVQGYDQGGAGYSYRYGAQIQCQAGAWGTTSGNGFVLGNTFFDEGAAKSPPPYFPTLPSFGVKSYQDMPILTGEAL